MKVAFYKAHGPYAQWDDKLIAFFTKGPYSHVEIVIDGFQYSAFAPDKGVRKKPHIVNDKVWDYIELNNINKQKILEFFEMTNGEKYDWLAVFGFVIPFKDRSNKWECSEWCSNALKISGCRKLWKQEPSKISPNRLYRILKG